MRKRLSIAQVGSSWGGSRDGPTAERRLQFEALEIRRLLTAVPQFLGELNPGGPSNPDEFVRAGGIAFFSANDGANGAELWKTDGTPGGTVMVKDIRPGSAGSSPKYLTAVGGTLFFAADDGTGGIELWKSDGTSAGTVMVKDINPLGSSSPGQLTNVGGTLFFRANDGANGVELWKSNGTAAGTVMALNIHPSGGSNPRYLTNVSGKLFFSADNGSNGAELWTSDPATSTTTLVKDINPGSGGSSPGYFGSMANVGGTLFFSAFDPTNGFELWKSNGTLAGTTLVKDVNLGAASSFPFVMTNVGGTLFFSANDGANGFELWKSDGTPGGTTLVKDINTTSPAGSTPDAFVNLNGTLFFRANDGAGGAELWKSDGTAVGTTMVSNINPSGSSTPHYLTNVGGTLFFRANDGTNGIELWTSDGTSGGTVMVADLAPGAASSNPRNLANVGGTLYFSAEATAGNQEPWLVHIPASVAAARIFYNQSTFDGWNAAANANDDLAVAPDKTAYRAGDGLAGPAHVTSYSRGINGIIVDIANPHGTLTLADFLFKMGTNNSPSAWAAAPAPSAMLVRPSAGVGGSDRIHLTWTAGSIVNRYLQVTVEGNDATGMFNTNTGLEASDVFYFGNIIGDTFESTPSTVFLTSSVDEISIQSKIISVAPITSIWDMDRNGVVQAADRIIARANSITALTRINLSPPAAPVAEPQSSGASEPASLNGLASALASPSGATNELRATLIALGIPVAGLVPPDAREVARAVLAVLVENDSPAGASAAIEGQSGELTSDDDVLDALLGTSDAG